MKKDLASSTSLFDWAIKALVLSFGLFSALIWSADQATLKRDIDQTLTTLSASYPESRDTLNAIRTRLNQLQPTILGLNQEAQKKYYGLAYPPQTVNEKWGTIYLTSVDELIRNSKSDSNPNNDLNEIQAMQIFFYTLLEELVHIQDIAQEIENNQIGQTQLNSWNRQVARSHMGRNETERAEDYLAIRYCQYFEAKAQQVLSVAYQQTKIPHPTNRPQLLPAAKINQCQPGVPEAQRNQLVAKALNENSSLGDFVGLTPNASTPSAQRIATANAPQALRPPPTTPSTRTGPSNDIARGWLFKYRQRRSQAPSRSQSERTVLVQPDNARTRTTQNGHSGAHRNSGQSNERSVVCDGETCRLADHSEKSTEQNSNSADDNFGGLDKYLRNSDTNNRLSDNRPNRRPSRSRSVRNGKAPAESTTLVDRSQTNSRRTRLNSNRRPPRQVSRLRDPARRFVDQRRFDYNPDRYCNPNLNPCVPLHVRDIYIDEPSRSRAPSNTQKRKHSYLNVNLGVGYRAFR